VNRFKRVSLQAERGKLNKGGTLNNITKTEEKAWNKIIPYSKKKQKS